MGQVAVQLTIMPDSPGVDFAKIKEEIQKIVPGHKNITLKSLNEKPVAFGLKAIEVLLVLPDTSGTDKLEQDIMKIPGVSSVEAGSITLI